MISLIVISSLLFMLILSASKELKDSKNITDQESNIHDFVVDFDNAQHNGNYNSNYNNSDDYYQYALENAANIKTNNFNNQFIWDRIETKKMYLNKDSNNPMLIKAVTDNENAKIDKIIITKGYNIGVNKNDPINPDNQVVVDPIFAKKHNLNIGSIIRLTDDNKGSNIKISSSMQSIPVGYNWFQVVGYGVSADFETPILTQTDIIPNKNNEGIVYINPSQFGLTSTLTQFNNNDYYWNYDISNDKWAPISTNDAETYYVGKFINGSEKNIDLIREYLSSQYNIKFDSINNINSSFNTDTILNIQNFFSNNINQLNIKNIFKQSDNVENNFKNYLINLMIKNYHIKWDNKWNINIFSKDNNNWNSLSYDQNNLIKYQSITIQISQNLLANEKNINSINFTIKNPLYNETPIINYNVKNTDSISDVANQVLQKASQNNLFSNINYKYLSIGNGNNYDYLKQEIIQIILNYAGNEYFSDVLLNLEIYLNQSLIVQFSLNNNNNLINSTDISNKGILNLILNKKDYKINTIINLNQNNFNYFQNAINPLDKFVYALGDRSYDYNSRTADLKTGINIFDIFTISMLIIVLIISAIILFMIVKKNLFYIRKQLGLLKALGYKNSALITAYISLPTYLIIISAILSYPLSVIAQYLFFNFIQNYFDLVNSKFDFSYSIIIFLISLASLFVFLTATSLTACYFAVSKPVNNILYDIKNYKKININLINFLKKPYKKSNFKVRFNISMLLKSLDKLAILFITLLFTILIFSSVIILPIVLEQEDKYSLIDDNYNSLVDYNTPIANSPYSFMKTYNPDSDSPIPPSTNQSLDYINALSDPNETNLSDNYYAPSPDSSLEVGDKLTNLTNVIFTNSFLSKMDQLSELASTVMCETTWADYSKIMNIWQNYDNSNIENIYNTYRQFYIEYKNTILLTINPRYIDHNNPNQKTNPDYIDFSNFSSDLNTELPNFQNVIKISDFNIDNNKIMKNTLNNGLTIYNDSDFLNENYDQINLQNKNDQINNYIKSFNTLFGTVYFGRLSQSIVQEIYSNSPYSLKMQIIKKIDKFDQKFDISFNDVPYDPKTDELGLMFNAFAPQHTNDNFNIYGINSDSKLLNLKDSKNHSIQNLLSKSNNLSDKTYNIIINQSLSKLMNWTDGNVYNLSFYLNNLEYNNNNNLTPININDYQSNELFSDSLSGDFRNINYENMKLSSFSANSGNNDNYLYHSIDPDKTDPKFANYPTEIEEQLQFNKIKLINKQQNLNVKVIAIDRSYGEPKAYINNNDAFQILNYQNSREFLFNMFKQEWQNFNNIKSNINFSSLLNFHNYENLLQDSLTKPNSKILLTMFNNEYPIFNYKMSKEQTPYDYISTTIVSNVYGDYTKIGLHGDLGYLSTKSNDQIQWNNYASFGLTSLTTRNMQKEIFKSLEFKLSLLLLMFLILAITIVFIIILSVSDVIFYENKRVILSMKVLGYNSWEINKSIFGFYLILGILTFIIGMPLTFYLIKFVLSFLTLALPLIFSWKFPVYVFIILSISFSIIFWINNRSIKKLNIKEMIDYE